MPQAETAAQADASGSQRATPRRPQRAAAAHVQLPRALLESRAHGPLAVVLWAHYEDLAAPGIGGRAPARMRRARVGEAYGIGTTTVDAARRELLADGAGGAWLSRSAPLGCKRAVRHLALRRPRESGQRYVRVPQWTRERVWAGRGTKGPGRVSPAAWRLYARLIARTGDAGGLTDASVRELGALLWASPDTGRRRLAELEAAGLVAVTERPGGRLTLRVIVDQGEAEEAAARYAEHGRERGEPRQDPPQIAALTPRSVRHSPPAPSGTPQDAPPSGGASCGDASGAPACDDVQVGGGRAARPEAGGSGAHSKSGPTPRRPRVAPERIAVAAAVYRALPAALRERIPEHGSRRVLHAIAAELEHRTAEELAARIGERWQTWAYRTHEIDDGTAVAFAVVRRGYECPDVRCEAGERLDTGRPCGACAAARATAAAAAAPEEAGPAAAGPSTPTPTPPPVAEALRRATPEAGSDRAAAGGADATARGAALAWRLLAQGASAEAVARRQVARQARANTKEPPATRPPAAP
jgi:hypothetical protein